jgi:hypothetical protein
VLRLAIGIVIGAVIGFGAAWVVYEEPFASDPPGQRDVELAVAQFADTAEADCAQRTNPPNVWDCTTEAPDADFSGIGSCDFYTATISGERIDVEAGDPDTDDLLRDCRD